MIAACSVVGRIAAILLHVYCLTDTKMHEIAFGHYLIAYSCLLELYERPLFKNNNRCHMS